MSLLRLEGLSKTFPGRDAPSVDAVAFAVDAGGAVGLVGESGSGKSTTARMVAGLTRPDSGRVLLAGEEVVSRTRRMPRSARRDLQMVFQDPFASLNPRMTVLQLVGEGLAVHRIEPDPRRRRDRVVALLEQVGLAAADLDRHPRSFSGGQRQRIAIARALAVGPKLLVCDEPVSSLDVSVQAQVLNLLSDLRAETGVAILFIAHDLAVVRHLCERIVVLQGGRVVEEGSRDEVFEHPAHPYTRSLLAAVPVPDPAVARRRRATADQREGADA